ncbi:MAG: hypothetical protein HQL32_17395 [Planctomycetes bacterium]|nr:hypothetical protein [Planctomycetota bacterium]
MCGILGQINLKPGDLPHPELFLQSLNLQEHRGPDDFGVHEGLDFVLGHRRLSIIDLDSHAKQPMVSDCGQYIVVFNGEIYNYQELKSSLLEKGYVFQTSSDTEVLLYLFKDRGVDCLQDLIGMFAFALVDLSKNETYLVR